MQPIADDVVENGAVGLPVDSGVDGDAGKAGALGLLTDIATANDIDLLALLLEDTTVPADGTREGADVPGVGESRGLGLADDDEKALAFELDDLCSRYRQAMEPANETEQEIRDAYTMASTRGASSPGVSNRDDTLVSEALMVQVDQVAARLTTNLTAVQPPVKVDPVYGNSFDDADLLDLANSTQAFLCEYVPNEMDFKHLLPQAILRATKVGTAVKRIAWHEEERTTSFYPRNGDHTESRTDKVGYVKSLLIENRQMIVWPPTILNWQRDYEVVGHESWHSRSSWKQLAKQWKLAEDVVSAVEGYPGERDEGADRERERAGIDAQQLDGSKVFDPQVKLTELWCHLWLGTPYNRRVKFQVIMHRPTRRILWSGINPHFTGKHPYFPLRYKWGDLSAWGTGVGHEALNCWACDTALRNLNIENISAGAFYIVVRDGRAVHHTSDQPIRPGMEVVSDAPDTDYQPRKMGGEAPEVGVAIEENKQRLRESTGTPAVAMGMGDPVQKSGTGTGATLALIEQASLKVRMVDQTMREDLTAMYEFILELVAQYGNEGVFYNHVSPTDASRLQQLKYVPPRGRDISSMFRIRAMAPSAATSTEARRNNYLLVWSFAQQAVASMNQFVAPLLQQQGKTSELERWQWALAATMTEIMKRVLELHEVPGVMGLLPPLPESTPLDEQNNALTAQLQQASATIQQLYTQMQQLTSGASGGANGNDGQGSVNSVQPPSMDPSTMSSMMPPMSPSQPPPMGMPS